METKWTKGPWIVEDYRLGREGEFVICPTTGVTMIATTGRERVASECRANAALIAAAPTMFEALVAIRDSPQFRDRLENGIQQMVHAALAKARGEGRNG